jgi:hypothetical protein
MKTKNTLLLALAILLSGWMVAVSDATITVPNVFAPFTTIQSALVNGNFSTIAEAALNRHGDNIDGNITTNSGVSIDGAIIHNYLANSKVSAASTAADAIKSGGGITAGTGVVGIVGTDGRIPALSTTYVANQAIPANVLTNGVIAQFGLKQYYEAKNAISISSNTLTVDWSTGTYFSVSLNANITTVTFNNICSTGTECGVNLLFTGDGTQRTITWPGAVKWPSGTAPTPTSTNGKVDIYAFATHDGGTTIFGFISGQNY